MSVFANKIITWGEIYTMVGEKQTASHGIASYFFLNHRTEDRTKCPTKAEILETGRLGITGSYEDNQCVKNGDVYILPMTFEIKIQENLIVNPTTDYIKIYHNGSGSMVLYKSVDIGTTNGSQIKSFTFDLNTTVLKATQFRFECGSTNTGHTWEGILKVNGIWSDPIGGVSDYGTDAQLVYDANSILSIQGFGFLIS